MKTALILLSLLALGCAEPESTQPIGSFPVTTAHGGGMVLNYEKNGVGESVADVSEVKIQPAATTGPGSSASLDVSYTVEGTPYVIHGVTTATVTQ